MTAPLLSIYIPMYNHGKFIGDNLKVLIDQIRQNGHQDITEVCISDNCSTDNSNQIIKKIISKNQDIKFNYTLNKENIGGLQNIMDFESKTSGEFVHMIGDDCYAPNGLNNVLQILKNNNKIDFLMVKTNTSPDFEFHKEATNEDFFRNVDKIGYIGNFIFRKKHFLTNECKSYVDNYYPHMILIFENIINARKYIDTRFVCINGRKSWNYDKSIKKLFMLLCDSFEVGTRSKDSIGEKYFSIYNKEVCKWVKNQLFRIRYHRNCRRISKMLLQVIPLSEKSLRSKVFFYGSPYFVFIIYRIFYLISILIRDSIRELKFKIKSKSFVDDQVTDAIIGNA